MRLFLILALVSISAHAFVQTRLHVVAGRRCKTTSLRAEPAADPAAAPAPAGIKALLAADMKAAMKSKDKEKLAGVRAIQTAIKQREVDDRVEVDEAEAVAIMSKLVKVRRESIKSYAEAGRNDLVAVEEAELAVIQSYMPAQLSHEVSAPPLLKSVARSNHLSSPPFSFALLPRGPTTGGGKGRRRDHRKVGRQGHQGHGQGHGKPEGRPHWEGRHRCHR